MKKYSYIVAGLLLAGFGSSLMAQSVPTGPVLESVQQTNGLTGRPRALRAAPMVTERPSPQFQRTNQPLSLVAASRAALRAAGANAPDNLPAPEPRIEIAGHGAVGRFGAHKVGFAANAHTSGAIDLAMADGQRLRSHVLGLCYYDPATGQSVMIGELKDSVGEVAAPNQVIYRDAFSGITADLVYTYTGTSLEQDVIIKRQLPSPNRFHLDPANTRLAVLTEFLEPPTPRKIPTVLDLRALNEAANISGEASLPDEMILFNTMRIVPGKAFSLDHSSVQIPVGKSWQKLDGRDFLVESTSYPLLKPQLDLLPEETAGITPGKKQPFRTALLQTRAPQLAGLKAGKAQFQVAQARPAERGVVLDYLIASTTLLNINFGAPTTNKIGFAAIGQTTNDYWNGYDFPGISPAAIANLKWSNTNNSGAGVTVLNGAGAYNNFVNDGMYGPYIYAQSIPSSITITLTNVPNGTYDFYVYGHSPSDADNSTFTLTSGTTNYGTNGTTIWSAGWNSTRWEEGQQYVTFRSVSVVSTQSVVLTVLPDHAGYPIISGLQMVSSGAVSNYLPAISQLMDINLGADPGVKVGLAARGLTTNDYWNAGYFPGVETPYAFPNMSWADNTSSSVGLTVTNAPGYYNNFVADGMYGPYIYPWDGGNIDISITNLPAAIYDFYVYGHSPSDGDDSLFQLTCGTNTFGPRGTTIWGAGWNSTNWAEGQQYVVFRNVPVGTNQPVWITVLPDNAGYAIISGIQIVKPVLDYTIDTDGDGMSDGWEIVHGLNPYVNDASGDPDGDGLTNLQEYIQGTDPMVPDLLNIFVTEPKATSNVP